ncbi:dehydratase [Actinomadura darangshiensis]|uniref:Dehydratase n=1 Tax=Actinomadura darangshiensis TaxID=705336 RepID=A0A4R5BGU9_9ACTN|nr:MaoC/PaaZ C-terminal domain-containing protein [Actinomadura darangshiensis]TDD83054.1 dehydratase [Actinomadura darangshiensis]
MPFTEGDAITFSKTVSESDVYQFAGVTGDLAPNHVDAEYMRSTPYGRRIAHGVLILGYTSTASTRALERANEHAVSYGYDRVRFTGPVFFGDTITVRYTTERVDPAERKIYSQIRVTNQDGDLCLVATHVLKLVDVQENA